MKHSIIRKLMHADGLAFSQLWDKETPSNKFAYHLKTLENSGLVEKKGEHYHLTAKGKQESAYIEGLTGKKAKAPLIGVLAVIIKDNKFLLCKRKKEPFYGYWGVHGGKLKFDQYILDCATTEIMEETGLECDVELKGLFSSKTYNDEELAYNHQMFIVKATNPKGKLIEETREGSNHWFTLEEIEKMDTFPNVVDSIKTAIGSGFRWMEADRTQNNNKFVFHKVHRNELL